MKSFILTVFISVVTISVVAQSELKIAQICDTQLGFGVDGFAADSARFEQAVELINYLKPDIAVFAGDMVNDIKNRHAIEVFLKIKNKLHCPVIMTAGNHDLPDPVTDENFKTYRKYFGKDFSTFEKNGFSIISANTQLWRGAPETLINQQDKLLQNALGKASKSGNKIIMLTHVPPFINSVDEADQYFNIPTETRKKLLKKADDNGVIIWISGHLHCTNKTSYGNITILNGETTCNNFDGHPHGFRFLTVSSDGNYNWQFIPLNASDVQGGNPISPPGVYIADPTARSDKNGKLYVYGSLDEKPGYYCSHRHDVLETSDLVNWRLYENTFASKGEGDEVPYSDAYLYAPDMIERDGKYYLYFCLSDGGEGVATSLSPIGPFREGKKIEGANGIDPTVFIDDDGQAYYYWGQFSAKGAKMNKDMQTIDVSTITDGLVTEKEHYFHEGGFVFKRNGIYYFVYAHMGRQDRPTCLGYATSSSPLGPFKYGGVIIDNAGSDPAVWNNHGSVAEFKGKWYVFYHRPTHNCVMMRKACVEPIEFRPDGSIPEVEMTSQGAGAPLKATGRIDAEKACLLHGNIRIQLIEGLKDNESLNAIHNGDRAAWKYIDYGEGVKRFTVRLRSKAGGKISIAGDKPWHGEHGKVEVPPDKNWTILSCNVRNLKGVQTLWLQFSGADNTDLFEIDWMKFE
ncbi:MAG: family 43 glycosylhydrolase [Tannerella sp.]|jgi:Icc-related predicted phosphoesterase|nr:family 43 glycosylhydrolase [Tannerella sp.]